MKRESFITGMLWMLLSATGLAFTGLLGKIGIESFTLAALIFWRFVAAFGLCALSFLCFGKIENVFHLPSMRMHLLRAFLILSAQYSFYYYLEHNTLLNAVVLLNTGPMFIPLIEWLVLRNKVGKSTWVGTAVSFIGVICLLQPDKGIFAGMSLIGLLAGLSQGASQVVFGINSKTERSESQVLILFFFCALFSMVPYLFTEATFVEGKGADFWLELLIVGLGVASIGNQLARAEAYQHGTPSRLAPFLYFSVLVAGILDWALFHKMPNLLSILGAGLVVLGGILKIYLRAKILKGKA